MNFDPAARLSMPEMPVHVGLAESPPAISEKAPTPEMEQTAAIKIQRAWKKSRQKMDFSGRFGAWYKEHHNNYIAPVCLPGNIDFCLESGKLMPEEMIFRKKRALEYELGRNTSKIVDVRDLSEFLLEMIKEMPQKLAWRQITGKGYQDPHCQTYPFKWKEYFQEQQKIQNELEEKLNAHDKELLDKDPEKIYELQNLSRIKMKQWVPEPCCTGKGPATEVLKYMQFMPEKNKLYEHHLEILRDELITLEASKRDEILNNLEDLNCFSTDLLGIFSEYLNSEKSIYKILAEHYKNLIASGVKPGEAYWKCMSAKNFEINQNTIKTSIHADINHVYWDHGDVFVLRGNGSDIPSHVSDEEATLLSPIENDGEFYCLDLKRDDTIILGPREKLEKYKKEYGDRIVYLEELTARQRNMLHLPKQFEPVSKQ